MPRTLLSSGPAAQEPRQSRQNVTAKQEFGGVRYSEGTISWKFWFDPLQQVSHQYLAQLDATKMSQTAEGEISNQIPSRKQQRLLLLGEGYGSWRYSQSSATCGSHQPPECNWVDLNEQGCVVCDGVPRIHGVSPLATAGSFVRHAAELWHEYRFICSQQSKIHKHDPRGFDPELTYGQGRLSSLKAKLDDPYKSVTSAGQTNTRVVLRFVLVVDLETGWRTFTVLVICSINNSFFGLLMELVHSSKIKATNSKSNLLTPDEWLGSVGFSTITTHLNNCLYFEVN